MKTFTLTGSQFLPAAFLMFCLSAEAQKLPNVQTVNVWAPVDVKTDGKPTEWGDRFEAYNKNTSVFYTMANDNDKLYLTIQATHANTIAKILSGGITLTVKSVANATSPLSITYPLIGTKGGLSFILMKIKGDQPIADSDLNAINNQLSIGCKKIKVTGVTQVTDTMLSVYNTEGIKAAGLFDHQKAYTYELAISLNYLEPFVNDLDTFNYNIILTGSNVTNINAVTGTNSDALQHTFNNLTIPSYFSGRYTLVKK